LETFLEVGSALLTIRKQRLYRASHSTFESYCADRWGISRSYAWRVLGAAERVRLLPPGSHEPKPSNECQMRPFLKLRPAEFPSAWKEVLKRANDRKVTAALVQEVVDELISKEAQGGAATRPAKRPARSAQMGEVLALLQEAKRAVEKGFALEATYALERIESLLFEPQVLPRPQALSAHELSAESILVGAPSASDRFF
jgi:hypothetical protein